jgi:hypothetical protein
MQRCPELSMQQNLLRTICPELHRRQQIVRTRTFLTDHRSTAKGRQGVGDRDIWLPANSLQWADANATIAGTRIAARATNPSSGGTKQCTKVPVVGHSCTNSQSPELRDCNRSWHKDIPRVTATCCPATHKRSDAKMVLGSLASSLHSSALHFSAIPIPTHEELQKLNWFALFVSGGAGM